MWGVGARLKEKMEEAERGSKGGGGKWEGRGRAWRFRRGKFDC
jgi:hypothetical protein